jgi:hypothetical protein
MLSIRQQTHIHEMSSRQDSDSERLELLLREAEERIAQQRRRAEEAVERAELRLKFEDYEHELK